MLKPFLLGAVGYPVLELLTRGRTHPSMALAGGLSAAAFHRISRLHASLAGKSLLGGAAVTLIEAICGFLWNRRHRIWDYRRMPLNWRGHVCLPYTLLWTGMVAAWMLIDRPAAAAPLRGPRSGPRPSRRS